MSRVFLRVSHPLPEIFFSSCSNSGSSHEFRAAFNMFQPSFGWISHGETTQWPHGARVTIPDPVKRTDQRTDQDPVEVSRLESACLFDWMHDVYIFRYVYMMYICIHEKYTSKYVNVYYIYMYTYTMCIVQLLKMNWEFRRLLLKCVNHHSFKITAEASDPSTVGVATWCTTISANMGKSLW